MNKKLGSKFKKIMIFLIISYFFFMYWLTSKRKSSLRENSEFEEKNQRTEENKKDNIPNYFLKKEEDKENLVMIKEEITKLNFIKERQIELISKLEADNENLIFHKLNKYSLLESENKYLKILNKVKKKLKMRNKLEILVDNDDYLEQNLHPLCKFFKENFININRDAKYFDEIEFWKFPYSTNAGLAFSKNKFKFQKLGEKDIYIFSTFYDTRSNDFDNQYNETLIRMMTFARKDNLYKSIFYCIFQFPSESISAQPLVFVSRVNKPYELSENHGKALSAFILSCNVPDDLPFPPCHVVLVTQDPGESNFRWRRGEENSKKQNFEKEELRHTLLLPIRTIRQNNQHFQQYINKYFNKDHNNFENNKKNNKEKFKKISIYNNYNDDETIHNLKYVQKNIFDINNKNSKNFTSTINDKDINTNNNNNDKNNNVDPNKGKSSNYCVCVPPIFGRKIRIQRVVEFIEILKIIGFDQFYFYIYSPSSFLFDLLEHYQLSTNQVHLIPWPLPFKPSMVWYYGQLISIQDCLYRSMHHSKFTAFFDLDELLVPRIHPYLETLVSKLNQPHLCGFQMDNVFFDVKPDIEYDDETIEEGIEKIKKINKITLIKNKEKTINIDNIRTKCLVKPYLVFETGIHHVSKPITSHYKVLHLNSSMAIIHHYKGCTIFSKYSRCGKKTFDNYIETNYKSDLTISVLKRGFLLERWIKAKNLSSKRDQPGNSSFYDDDFSYDF